MIEPGVAVDHVADGTHCCVIVGSRVNADPILGEIDTRYLLPLHGAPYMGPEAADPRDGPQLATDLGRDPDDFIMGRARRGHPVHEEILLLEGREQRLPKKWQHREADHHEGTDGEERRARRADDPPEEPLVATLQPAQEGGLAPLERDIAQEEQAQRRRGGQRHHHRGQQGQRIGDGERLEEGARHAPQEEDRQQDHDIDQHGIDDGAAHLMLAQPPYDILHVDDGVIDDATDGNHKPRQDHRVDGGPAQVEHKPRCHQGQWDRHQADQGGTPLEEEGSEDQHHK